MALVKKHRTTIAVLFSVVLPILGCVGGYWYGSWMDWRSLSSPPARPERIVGLGLEHSAESEILLIVQTSNGDMYYYRHSAIEAERWVKTNEDGFRQVEEGSGPCVTARPFIPSPPGHVSDCVEYAGYYAKQDPEEYIEQWVLLDDGTIWKWDYPDTIIRRNILFGFIGLLGGGLISAIILIGLRGNRG